MSILPGMMWNQMKSGTYAKIHYIWLVVKGVIVTAFTDRLRRAVTYSSFWNELKGQYTSPSQPGI